MSLRSPTENDNAAFVMPAWTAGIQGRKDASETSMLASIPALHAGMTQAKTTVLEVTEVLPPGIFKGGWAAIYYQVGGWRSEARL